VRTIIRVPVVADGEVSASVFADRISYIRDDGPRAVIVFSADVYVATTMKRQAIVDLIRAAERRAT